MRIKCPNSKCGYTWEYKGKLGVGFYTNCHRCGRKTLIRPIKEV